MTIYLASASPRRQELLTQIGIKYEVRVSGADEDIEETDPRHIVEQLSIYKAQAVAKELEDEGVTDYCVIGADTVVACDEKVLGKPLDEADAKKMLKLLSGRGHQVYTGVTLIMHKDGTEKTLINFHEVTTVNMYELSDAEIDAYIATGEPMDKAGAYGIQARAAAYVSGIEGDYYNVVGLPVARLYHELCKHGVM